MHCNIIQNRLTIYYNKSPVDEEEQDSTKRETETYS